MKKVLWMMALGMCLVAAGCSKGDDGLDIEKTYAEDDFVMNERNIKEKLVGEWWLESFRVLNPVSRSWNEYNKESLPDVMKTVKIRADGTSEFIGFYDVHWQLDGKDIIIQSAYLYACDEHGDLQGGFLLSDGWWGLPRYNATESLRKDYPGMDIVEQLKRVFKFRIDDMSLNRFVLSSQEGQSLYTTECVLRRK